MVNKNYKKLLWLKIKKKINNAMLNVGFPYFYHLVIIGDYIYFGLADEISAWQKD